MVDFSLIIEKLIDIGFYRVFLPFILVYAIVFAILVGILLGDSLPTFITTCGIVLIVGAGIMVAREK